MVLREVIVWETGIFLAALLGIMVSFLFSGRINTAGLLSGRNREGRCYLSPERVQLLMSTIALAVQYTFQVLHSDLRNLPEVPQAWLAILGGSHGVYLGGKMWNSFSKGPLARPRRK